MNINPADVAGGSLAAVMADLETRLAEVLKETRRLRSLVRELEAENQRLRTMMFAEPDREGGGWRLRRFYDEGYHICPAQFARVRGSEGCLFCQNFLEKKGLPPHE